jgi:hypothetical protein
MVLVDWGFFHFTSTTNPTGNCKEDHETLGVIIFSSVFIKKKVTKPKFKKKKNQNRFKPIWLGFSIFSGLARVLSVRFFRFKTYKTESVGFFGYFFPDFLSFLIFLLTPMTHIVDF